MKTSNSRDPYKPRFKYFAVSLFGNKSNNMCEPSSGGIGNKLNANKNTLRNTPYQSKSFIIKFWSPKIFTEIRKKTNSNTERIKFERGPANETTASSFKGSLKFLLSIGTGLAHPINANPDAKAASGMITLPIRSICLKGFNVNLPRFFAVLSPRLFAKNAWEYSWTEIERRNIGKNIKKFISLSLIWRSGNINLLDETLYEPA